MDEATGGYRIRSTVNFVPPVSPEPEIKDLKVAKIYGIYLQEQQLCGTLPPPVDPSAVYKPNCIKKDEQELSLQIGKTETRNSLSHQGDLGVDLQRNREPVQSIRDSRGFDCQEPTLSNVFVARKVVSASIKGFEDMLEKLPFLPPSQHDEGVVLNTIDLSKGYQYKYHLGRGGFGSVSLYRNGRMKFVSKMILKKEFNQNEVIVPIILNHPNITKVFGLLQKRVEQPDSPVKMELLMEYAGTSLRSYLKSNCLTARQIWSLTGQGLRGLVHIHEHGFIHMDIKPENIIVQPLGDGEFLLKIADFGSAKLSYDELSTKGCTPGYMAPETARLFLQKNKLFKDNTTKEQITAKHDMFAFGFVVMFMYKRYHILVQRMTGGFTSYGEMDKKARQMMKVNLMGFLATNRAFIQNVIPGEADKNMQALLQELIHYDCQERANAKEALQLFEGYQSDPPESGSSTVLEIDTAANVEHTHQKHDNSKQRIRDETVVKNSWQRPQKNPITKRKQKADKKIQHYFRSMVENYKRFEKPLAQKQTSVSDVAKNVKNSIKQQPSTSQFNRELNQSMQAEMNKEKSGCETDHMEVDATQHDDRAAVDVSSGDLDETILKQFQDLRIYDGGTDDTNMKSENYGNDEMTGNLP